MIGQLEGTDAWGSARRYDAVLVTCQSWLLTTQIACEESLCLIQGQTCAFDMGRMMGLQYQRPPSHLPHPVL
jgi:tryptophan 2-monooxygenase